MKEQSAMRKTLIVISIVLVVGVFAGMRYGKDVAGFLHSGASSTEVNGRKILYWYAPMNPNYHSDHPGKSPMGMDLLPKYADEAAPATTSDTSSRQKKILYWYDPMHPSYKSDKPGIAPDCGMKLVPKYADDADDKLPSGTIRLSPERQQLISVRTTTVEREPLTRTIRTTGHLVPDESKIAHVHVKVNGWIDKVYVDFVGQLVKKGQPLFTVYSPDLVATEQEYLIALKGKKYLDDAPYREVSEGADSLVEASRERLKLWDISDAQIKSLEQTGKAEKTMTFYSPVSGFVLDRQAFPQAAVGPDKELYLLADLSDIWVDADVYEYELPYVRVGQKAVMQLSYTPGKTYTGRVTYVYPTVDPQTRTAKVRLQFPNPNFDLKPQMFADVSLEVNYGTNVVVPASAVLDSGTRKTVFIAKGDGYFEPREIQVGPQVDDKYVVLSGLRPGETIVTSGNFMIDSESQLNAATGDMSSQQK
jgi:membrane fusion protein, copper/silver efflux system